MDTPIPILIIKLALSLIVIVSCLLSIFLSGKLLGYGMAGLGLLVLIYGIEDKIKNQENVTLILGVLSATIFFAISGYIFTNPLI